VLLLSNEGDFVQLLSVGLLELLEFLDLLSQLASSGLEQVLEGVISSLDIDGGVLDVLFQRHDQSVVLVSSDVEVEIQLLELIVQISNQFFDSGDQFLNWTSDHGVQVNQLEDGSAPLALVEFLNVLLGGLSHVLNSH